MFFTRKKSNKFIVDDEDEVTAKLVKTPASADDYFELGRAILEEHKYADAGIEFEFLEDVDNSYKDMVIVNQALHYLELANQQPDYSLKKSVELYIKLAEWRIEILEEASAELDAQEIHKKLIPKYLDGFQEDITQLVGLFNDANELGTREKKMELAKHHDAIKKEVRSLQLQLKLNAIKMPTRCVADLKSDGILEVVNENDVNNNDDENAPLLNSPRKN